ncbi:hypothetical protein BJ684DRAFT_14350 [Piptocephalis cylindrospora]|uniref:Uncharacterized protein n=1 Tax=Piptocephalis cylindrospora TaxID=1907219 RepID=A0A4P9Y8I6_9FUNG|nr:hypothetical protein BJ684DRAFT_14350 [Piptocephalis cylindrospora]|eukprot:RKP15393.1 hypothetical protein BJ684DRAFT_14350 [Piptocephalis cylindrospora]
MHGLLSPTSLLYLSLSASLLFTFFPSSDNALFTRSVNAHPSGGGDSSHSQKRDHHQGQGQGLNEKHSSSLHKKTEPMKIRLYEGFDQLSSDLSSQKPSKSSSLLYNHGIHSSKSPIPTLQAFYADNKYWFPPLAASIPQLFKHKPDVPQYAFMDKDTYMKLVKAVRASSPLNCPSHRENDEFENIENAITFLGYNHDEDKESLKNFCKRIIHDKAVIPECINVLQSTRQFWAAYQIRHFLIHGLRSFGKGNTFEDSIKHLMGVVARKHADGGFISLPASLGTDGQSSESHPKELARPYFDFIFEQEKKARKYPMSQKEMMLYEHHRDFYLDLCGDDLAPLIERLDNKDDRPYLGGPTQRNCPLSYRGCIHGLGGLQ